MSPILLALVLPALLGSFSASVLHAVLADHALRAPHASPESGTTLSPDPRAPHGAVQCLLCLAARQARSLVAAARPERPASDPGARLVLAARSADPLPATPAARAGHPRAPPLSS